jgi:CheY-like chemotaxis protein
MRLDLYLNILYPKDNRGMGLNRQPKVPNHKCVLVVDDNDDFRMLLCDWLQALGITYLQAKNGEEAREQLHHGHVDLVVTDNCMPIMNGIDLIRWIRQNQKPVPIIFMSGHFNDTVKEAAKQAEVFAIVEKSGSLHDLKVKIREALNGKGTKE